MGKWLSFITLMIVLVEVEGGADFMVTMGCSEECGRKDRQSLDLYVAHKHFTLLFKLLDMILLKLLAYM